MVFNNKQRLDSLCFLCEAVQAKPSDSDLLAAYTIRSKKTFLSSLSGHHHLLAKQVDSPKSNEMVLTVHRWFANKSCPGDYLYNLHPQIVSEVNQRLSGSATNTGTAVSYQVRVTAMDGLNCRTSPINGSVVTAYENGTILNISKEQNGWGYTGIGWVSLEWTKKIASTTVTEEDEDMTLDTFKKLMNEYREELRDNDCGDWSKEARDWATSTGLFAGGTPLPDGSPNYMWADTLTREQAAQLFYNFAKKNGIA